MADYFSSLSATTEPLVSVCVTAYNHAPYIAQCLDSILAQECDFGVEIVLGEDCSSDSTLEICRSYEARYPNSIRVITSPENVGMRANYRRVVESSRGKYIAFCDGDDYFLSVDKLRLQVEALEQNPECGLCCTRSLRFVEGEDREWSYPVGRMHTQMEDLLFNNTVENCTALARRDLMLRYYQEVRPEEHPEWLTDDAPMWIWFSSQAGVVCLEEQTAAHRLLRESVSQSRDYRRKIAFCDSLMDISLWMDSRYGANSQAKRLLRRRMEVALWVLSREGSIKEYICRWWRDVRRTPSLLFNLAGYGLIVKNGLKRIKNCD